MTNVNTCTGLGTTALTHRPKTVNVDRHHTASIAIVPKQEDTNMYRIQPGVTIIILTLSSSAQAQSARSALEI